MIYGRVKYKLVHEEKSAGIVKNSLRQVHSSNPAVIIQPLPSPEPHVCTSRKLQSDIVCLILFGFLVRHKGHLFLIKAIQRLPERIRLVLAGGPHPLNPDSITYESEIYGEIMVYRLSDRVSVTGWIPEDALGDILSSADIGVLPYTCEGQSNSAAALDLLAAGLPVVASDVYSLVDLARKCQAVCLYQRENFDTFASALDYTIVNYERLSKVALDFTEQNSIANFAKKLIEHCHYQRQN
jgi:glycosyltransferase involved in cell wall biosynthesis